MNVGAISWAHFCESVGFCVGLNVCVFVACPIFIVFLQLRACMFVCVFEFECIYVDV